MLIVQQKFCHCSYLVVQKVLVNIEKNSHSNFSSRNLRHLLGWCLSLMIKRSFLKIECGGGGGHRDIHMGAHWDKFQCAHTYTVMMLMQ